MNLTALTPPQRSILFLTTPSLWPHWPFLPLVRRSVGEPDLGILYDFRHSSGRTGFSSTVFITNLFLIPASEKALLELPREVFDTAEEVVAAGWNVD